MQRNFDRRVEIAFPVLDPQHQTKLKNILEVQLADNFKSWQVRPDGTSVRLRSDDVPQSRSQEQLYEVMRQEPRDSATRPPLAAFE
jgi:polyphosphate kinase